MSDLDALYWVILVWATTQTIARAHCLSRSVALIGDSDVRIIAEHRTMAGSLRRPSNALYRVKTEPWSNYSTLVC